MSKIVCDICGTNYDDSVGSCPVCGWNKDSDLNVDNSDIDIDFLDDDFKPEAPAAAAAPKKPAFDYESANSRRAQKPAPKPAAPKDEDDDDDDEEEESGSNTFLVIILVLLILALLAVSAYIGWTKILKPKQMGNENNKPQETITAEPLPTQTTPVIPANTEATAPTVPCTELSLVGTMETLTFKGQYWRLMVKTAPENTTDKPVFTSSNESVVTIDEYGRVTAVGEGEALIVVTCGDQRLETPAVVKYQAETTESGTAATSASTPAAGTSGNSATGNTAGTTVATPSSVLKLKKSDITIGRRGVYVTLELEGGISADSVKWSTSDSSVATVYNGNVTAIGKGTCIVTAEYNGQTAQCVVRCKF